MQRPLNLSFTLTNSNITTAKQIKDYLYEGIPVIAIDGETVLDINASFNEDVLFNSVGFLSIDSTYADTLVDTDVCPSIISEGKICPNCAVVYTVDEYNDSDNILTITTDNFKTSNPLFPFTTNQGARQVVAKLSKGESIKMIFIARRGYGLTHAKWIPVSKVVYDYDKSWGYDYKAYYQAKVKDQSVSLSNFVILANKYNFRIECIGQYDANEILSLIKARFPEAELTNVVVQ